MFNLRNFNGTFKGVVGECLLKLAYPDIILTRFFNRFKFMTYYDIKDIKKEFLLSNWFSVDGIKVIGSRVLLFEIKTKNQYKKNLNYKEKISKNSLNIYIKAKELGFDVRFVSVKLFENWNYEIEIKKFNPEEFCIDKKWYGPKRN